MEIVEERRRLREEVLRRAREWAQNLQFKASAILIGSYARGDFNLWSDVDVVLIAELSGNPIERLKNIDLPPGFEVIPLTPNEFTRLLEKKNPLAIEALSGGIILRDDLEVKNLLKRLRFKNNNR